MEMTMQSPNLTLVKEAVFVDGYVRVSKAAELLGVTTRTVTRWIHAGRFDGVVKNDPMAETGSFFLIPKESIADFLEKRKTSFTPSPKDD